MDSKMPNETAEATQPTNERGPVIHVDTEKDIHVVGIHTLEGHEFEVKKSLDLQVAGSTSALKQKRTRTEPSPTDSGKVKTDPIDVDDAYNTVLVDVSDDDKQSM
ncbi:glycosyltransferase family 2 protein [Sesbania bispinosa]|nr:glycosyltransferase family 2 protein [Sesbania bispinosa]